MSQRAPATSGKAHGSVPVTVNGGPIVNAGPVQNGPHVEVITREGGVIHPFLFDILSQATPHGHEHLIIPTIEKFIAPTPINKDEFGNVYVVVGENPETMFSCHLDTVHAKPDILTLLVTNGTGKTETDGMVYAAIPDEEWAWYFKDSNKRVWKYEIDKSLNELHGKDLWQMVYDDTDRTKINVIVHDKEKANPPIILEHVLRIELIKKTMKPCVLGADDKLGIFTCCMLIRHGVPGIYVFHLGEECGGLGSAWIKKNNRKFFEGIKRCVAFDRMHYDDVIAHQRAGRTASAEFTNALADQINANIATHIGVAPQIAFKGDQRGVWTDSANYTEFVQECTNVSVGYFKQHGPQEHFDAIWFQGIFIPAILNVDWNALPTVKAVDEPYVYKPGNTGGWQGNKYGGYGDYGGYYGSGDYWGDMDDRTIGKHDPKDKKDNVTNFPNTPGSSGGGRWVDISDVTKLTPFAEVPVWVFEDSFIPGASKEGMERMVWKHLFLEKKNLEVASKYIVEALSDYERILSKLLEERRQHDARMTELRTTQTKLDDAEQLVGQLVQGLNTMLKAGDDADVSVMKEGVRLLLDHIAKSKVSY